VIWEGIRANHYKVSAKRQRSRLSDAQLNNILGDREHLASRMPGLLSRRTTASIGAGNAPAAIAACLLGPASTCRGRCLR
jgi:hypothetical protein